MQNQVSVGDNQMLRTAPPGPVDRSTHRRYTPIDDLMRDIERDYRAGRIGITDDGELMPLTDIYEDMACRARPTDYRIASSRDMDRETHRACTHCGIAYRSTDQRDRDRCPYCWRLI